jgi:hypothetical protein
MAALIPNIAKGKFAYYATLPAANDALIAVLLKASGLESDATLRDYDDLAAILAASNDEETATGYSRFTLLSNTSTVDDTNDRVDTDCADPTWTTTTALASGKIVFCYDPDTTGGTDSSVIPVFMDDFVVSITGTVTYSVAAAGWGRAS